MPNEFQRSEPAIAFTCEGCGLTLSIPAEQAGISGPCPSCGTWITSPAAIVPPSIRIPARKIDSPRMTRSKGRIPPDAIVDQAHLEQRESAKTLRVLSLFVLAICACLATAWFLKEWIAK